MERDWEYQVALSFAGEQRSYVEKVSKELSMLGVRHFYDNDNKAVLWGKNLTQYLDEIYFLKSRFVVVFISREYKDKIWTRWEMRSAQDRALRDENEYILPVYFDETRLPGLVGSLGHIDAKNISPKELARLIFAKLNSTPVQYTEPNSNYVFSSPVFLNMELHKSEKEQLESIYEGYSISTAVTVFGEKGVGKSSTISSFLNGRKNVVHVVPLIEPHYQYEAIVNALGDQDIFSSTSDLSVPERIKNYIIDLCKKSEMIFYFEGADQYDSGLVSFIIEICKQLLLYHAKCKAFIIFEYDNDGQNEFERQLYSFPPFSIKFLQFKRISAEILKRYLRETIGNVAIDDTDLTYIIGSANGNVMYLNTIINYLNMKGLLNKTTGQCSCVRISEGELTNVLSEYIQERYERLDENLKDVLNKSAIIGNTFSSELLSRPFRIIHAEELLNKIEAISRLIKHEDAERYSFESFDSFRIICNAIRSEESRKWHSILGRYYIRRYERMQSSRIPPAEDQKIYHLHSATKHFKAAGDYGECITYAYELIKAYIEISDYDSARKTISEARFLLDILDDHELPFPDLDYNINILDAKCLCEIGQFADASILYNDCIVNAPTKCDYIELSDIKLACALCYYMDGRITEAITLAEESEKELRTISADSIQYCKTLALLASFYDCTGDCLKKKNYYIKAVTICRNKHYQNEYYHLLKMASMVYDESFAIDMYPAALEYFEKHYQKKNIAELHHNISTDLLYLGRQAEIPAHIAKSIDTFSSFGSLMIVYPLNTQGIFTAIFENNYDKAIEIFKHALEYKAEPYSKIVIMSNLTTCFLKQHQHSAAYSQLLEIDRIASLPESKSVYDFQVYRLLAWGQYFYYACEYKKCIEYLTMCEKMPSLEARFRYMCTFFIYLAKKTIRDDR